MTTKKEKFNLLTIEKQLWQSGIKYIAGIDEAGRGPLAGPVVAAAVIFPPLNAPIEGIDDSKRLTPQKRQYLKKVIFDNALGIGIGIVDQQEIDELNILQATYKAMKLAVENLQVTPDYILIDGRGGPSFNVPGQSIIKGDARSLSIAAASIIAKVTRDEIMIEYDSLYPIYGFARHKGYPTSRHIQAIRQYGFCPIHRRSFKPKALSGLTL